MSPLYHFTTIAAAMLVLASAQDRPLLSSIATIPELYTFSAVVNGTGGNRLNPALEERFNSVLDRRNYTALVPTNDVSGNGARFLVSNMPQLVLLTCSAGLRKDPT